MILGHTIALDPTVKQAAAMQRACGVARFTYNWALGEWNRQYRVGEKPNVANLRKRFNSLKGEQFPWIYESPRDANAHAFAHLGEAFSNFFESKAGRRAGPKVSRPTFKRKGKCSDSFYVANDKFHFHADGRRVYLPVIGSVRTRERLRFSGKVVSGTVKRIADRWYLSVRVEGAHEVPWVHQTPRIGVDLGLKTAVVMSNAQSLDAPNPLKKALKKLRRANKSLHRKVLGSANRRKAQEKLARLHRKIANVRNDFLHKTTTKIARETQAAIIEDLGVDGMKKLRALARAISDVGMGEFRRQLVYKGPKFGCDVIIADRWFPSSKRCSYCGLVKDELPLSQRMFACDGCFFVEDRDRNAALNLEAYPGLPGNGRKAEARGHGTPTRRPSRRASAVVEAGTNP